MEDYKIEARNNKLASKVLNYEWKELISSLPADTMDKIKSLIKEDLIEANVKSTNNNKFVDIFNKWEKIRIAIDIKMLVDNIDGQVLESILEKIKKESKPQNLEKLADTNIYMNVLTYFNEDEPEMDVEFFYKDKFVLRATHSPLMGGIDEIQTENIDKELLSRLLMELRGVEDNFYGNIRVEENKKGITFFSEEEECATITNEGLNIIDEYYLANLFIVVGSYATEPKKKELKQENTASKINSPIGK